MHELFDNVSEAVEKCSDLLAELAGGLCGIAHSSIRVAAERSILIPHMFYSGDISEVQASRPSAVAIQKPLRVPDLAQAIGRAPGAPHA